MFSQDSLPSTHTDSKAEEKALKDLLVLKSKINGIIVPDTIIFLTFDNLQQTFTIDLSELDSSLKFG
jgi:hypothetical protein